MQTLKKFVKDESGLEIVEYAILAGLIVVAIIALFPGLKEALVNLYTRLATDVETLAAQ